MFEKSHKNVSFSRTLLLFLYALLDMFSFRISSFPSVFFYLGLELGLRIRLGLMSCFAPSFLYSLCLWSTRPSTVHPQTWYTLFFKLILLAHCIRSHQQTHYMISIRFVTYLANPGKYTLLHSTHLSPSAHMERSKIQDSKHGIQDTGFLCASLCTFCCIVLSQFCESGWWRESGPYIPLFFVFFVLAGVVTKQNRYDRQEGTKCAGMAHIAP